MFFLLWTARRLVVFVIVLAIPIVAAEYLARLLLGDAVKNAIVARIGGSAGVGFGSTPVLLQMIDGHLNDVTVSEQKADIGGLPTASLAASLHDVHLKSITDLKGGIGAITATVALSSHGVRDLLATPACVDSLPPSLLAVLSDRPRVHISTADVALLPPRGKAVELHLYPSDLDGTISFRLTGLDIGRAPASSATFADVARRLDCTRSVSGLPFNLRLKSVDANPGALAIRFVATNASFSAS